MTGAGSTEGRGTRLRVELVLGHRVGDRHDDERGHRDGRLRRRAAQAHRSADNSGSVDVSHGPVNPTVTPDGRHVYVAKSVGGGIAVIDVETQAVTSVIDPGGPKPSGLAFTPDGKRLVVTLLGETVDAPGAIAVIDCATGEAAPPIPVEGQPERVALSPDGRRAYVVSIHGQSLWVFDLDAREIVTRIPMGDLPFNVLVSPDGERVYVGNLRSDYIAVIDTRSDEVVGTIDVPCPNGMAFSPDRRSMYVTSVFDDSVHVIDLEAGKVVRRADVGEKPGYSRSPRRHAGLLRPPVRRDRVGHGHRDARHRGHDRRRQGPEHGGHPRRPGLTIDRPETTTSASVVPIPGSRLSCVRATRPDVRPRSRCARRAPGARCRRGSRPGRPRRRTRGARTAC